MANVFRIILFSPLALIYGLVLRIRHWGYDSGLFSSFQPSVPTICVGNLELGGSGKTPMVAWLIQKLGSRYKMAVLSRGYRRKSTGFLEAKEGITVDQLGDESFQIYSGFKEQVIVAVDENRSKGIKELLYRHPEIQLILLDDALQHRKVNTDLQILLSPFHRPFFQNWLFPSGTLRDLASRWKKAQILILTKAQEANEEVLSEGKEMAKRCGVTGIPLFVSTIDYKTPRNADGKFLAKESPVTCVAGLASNTAFFNYTRQNFSVTRCISKSDHSPYLNDFFQREALKEALVLTTEKDFHKLIAVAPDPEKIFFLPIEIRIYPENQFLETLEKSL